MCCVPCMFCHVYWSSLTSSMCIYIWNVECRSVITVSSIYNIYIKYKIYIIINDLNWKLCSLAKDIIASIVQSVVDASSVRIESIECKAGHHLIVSKPKDQQKNNWTIQKKIVFSCVNVIFFSIFSIKIGRKSNKNNSENHKRLFISESNASRGKEIDHRFAQPKRGTYTNTRTLIINRVLLWSKQRARSHIRFQLSLQFIAIIYMYYLYMVENKIELKTRGNQR